MTDSNITDLRPNSDSLLINISDRLGELALKAGALNLAIRALDADSKFESAALDYLSGELAHELEAFRDDVGEGRARRRKAKGAA